MKPFRPQMCPHLSQCTCPGLGFLLASSSTEAPKPGVWILWGPPLKCTCAPPAAEGLVLVLLPTRPPSGSLNPPLSSGSKNTLASCG